MRKKLRGLWLALALALTFCACAQGETHVRETAPPTVPASASAPGSSGTAAPEEPGTGAEEPALGSNVLVAYFSWSGNTAEMAAYLAAQTGGDLLEIQPETPYPDSYNDCGEVALAERDADARPAIANLPESLAGYDTLLIGYPIWWHTAPMIIGTFLESYDWSGVTVYPFAQSTSMDTEQFANSMDFVRACAAGAEVVDGLFAQPEDTGAIDAYLAENGLLAAAAEYAYTTQELYIQRDENQIYAQLYVPETEESPLPAVIISHGFGGNYAVGAPYARALAARGYVVCCFDFCGGSPGSRSGGSTLEMSLFTEQADLEAVMAAVGELAYVDGENLFLMGTSQGGAVSAITAAAQPEAVRGMVLLYPAFVMVDTANELFARAEDIPDTYYFMWMEVGRAYFEPLLGYDIYGEIAAYDRDVLLLHGDADTIVPLAYSQRALEVYPSAELLVFPGAGHGFSGEDADRAVAEILTYLEAHRV